MIKLTNIHKSFGKKQVLQGFTAEFDKGINFLLGDTGKGKTTVLKIIMGLETPDSGTINVPEYSIAPVFQENRLLENLDVASNISYVTDVEMDMETVYNLHIEELLHKKTSKLSGGTKRIVALLRALTCNAQVLILDEPFTGMDDEAKKRAMDTIIDKSKGKIVIISTHDKYAVEYMGGKIIEVM